MISYKSFERKAKLFKLGLCSDVNTESNSLIIFLIRLKDRGVFNKDFELYKGPYGDYLRRYRYSYSLDDVTIYTIVIGEDRSVVFNKFDNYNILGNNLTTLFDIYYESVYKEDFINSDRINYIWNRNLFLKQYVYFYLLTDLLNEENINY